MNIPFYSSVSAMVSFQQDMDVLAHNMANVNTHGFKPSRTAFSDLLYTEMAINENKQLTGHGVKPIATDLDMTQGPLQTTGYPLDFAIEGDGFFALERNGDRSYTRNGAFHISIEGNKGFLVNGQGDYVLDASGKPVELKKIEGSNNSFEMEGIERQLGVYSCPNPYGLTQIDGSRFKESEKSGEVLVVKTKSNGKDKTQSFRVLSRALETSGVSVAQGMTDVMITQKAFQMNARMVQTADQLDEVISGLR